MVIKNSGDIFSVTCLATLDDQGNHSNRCKQTLTGVRGRGCSITTIPKAIRIQSRFILFGLFLFSLYAVKVNANAYISGTGRFNDWHDNQEMFDVLIDKHLHFFSAFKSRNAG